MVVDEIRSLALSLVIGFVVTALIGSRFDPDPGATAVGTVLMAGLTYLAWCRMFRTRVCPRCKSKRERTDGQGHQRPRNCRRCGGDGRERRFGAVLQGLPKR